VLTKRPDIVYAVAPKCTRRHKAKPADMPKVAVIVEARDPRWIKHKQALATRIVDNRAPDTPDDEHHERGEAADRLWQKMVRAVNAPAQPVPDWKNSRTRSGQ
jgi:hypothetical protein